MHRRVVFILALIGALVTGAGGAHAQDPEGSVTVQRRTVTAGDLLEVVVQQPAEWSFIASLRIFPDDGDATPGFPLRSMLGSASIPGSGEPGTTARVSIDTLNFLPGRYRVATLAPGHPGHAWDSFEVLADDQLPARSAADLAARPSPFGLYDSRGRFLASPLQQAVEALRPGQVVALAVDLQRLNLLDNEMTVHLDHGAASGGRVGGVKVFRSLDLRSRSIAGEADDCGGTPPPDADPARVDGVAVAVFRAPAHQPYYDYSGTLRFTLEAARVGCAKQSVQIAVPFADDPALPAIETFSERNARSHPDQAWRDSYPFDTFRARLVRFGRPGGRLSGAAELGELAALLEEHFRIATKGYFELVVDGTEFVDAMPEAHLEAALAWYARQAKTPGMPQFDLNDADDLAVVAGLYRYHGMTEAEGASQMTSAYPPRSGGEDVTLYLFDGPGALGQAMGAGAARIQVARQYNRRCDGVRLWTDPASGTFHKHTECLDTRYGGTGGYLDAMDAEKTLASLTSTTLHELGHVLWLDRVGVSTGDRQTKLSPFRSDHVYADDSLGYFTRREYMSYGRNRNSLTGMSYGDAYLDELLSRYAPPMASGEVSLETRPGGRTRVTIQARCDAASGPGVAWLWYQSGPVTADYADPRFLQWRDAERSSVFVFELSEPGTYTYGYRCRDTLYPIAWQPHQSDAVTLRVQIP